MITGTLKLLISKAKKKLEIRSIAKKEEINRWKSCKRAFGNGDTFEEVQRIVIYYN